MDFFDTLEKSLENIIETALIGKGGGKVQPIEIARGLWRETTAGKRVSLEGTYVPNYFLLTLSGRDFSFLESVKDTVEREILDYLARESGERDFKTLGPVVIQWTGSDDVKSGNFCISSDFLKIEEIPPHLLSEKKASAKKLKKRQKPELPKEVPATKRSVTGGGGVLSVIEGFDQGKDFCISEPETVIGRSDTCSISVGDPKVSGRHARIILEDGGAVLEDLNSRGGTEVDGVRTGRAPLKHGSRIVMGGTVFIYKQELRIS